jgi:hypothetical protein
LTQIQLAFVRAATAQSDSGPRESRYRRARRFPVEPDAARQPRSRQLPRRGCHRAARRSESRPRHLEQCELFPSQPRGRRRRTCASITR